MALEWNFLFLLRINREASSNQGKIKKKTKDQKKVEERRTGAMTVMIEVPKNFKIIGLNCDCDYSIT